jgi:hypothetical protein
MEKKSAHQSVVSSIPAKTSPFPACATMTNRQVVGVLLLATFAAPAYAYSDPNAGGLIFQLLTPFLALAAAAVAFARRQLGRAWGVFLSAMRNLIDRLLRASRGESE